MHPMNDFLFIVALCVTGWGAGENWANADTNDRCKVRACDV